MANENLLNDLIGSRICHDLISPLGAIGNGVELLTMSGAGEAPELSLISQSVESANARIRFFRVAFGAASAEAKVGNTEIRSILRDVYRGSRVRVDWHIDADLPRAEVKLCCLLIQCLETALPWGGTITAARNDAGHWSLTATAERLKIDDALWDLISNPNSETQVTASEVQFALVPGLAARLQRTVRARNDTTGLAISF